MVDAELGTKRSCPECAAKFYDLNNDPIVCPKCGVSFVAEPILPSKGDQPTAAPPPRPAAAVEEDDTETEDVELVSLEDVEGDDDAGDDIEDEAPDLGDVEDTFLEEEEEEEGVGVSAIIGGAKPEGEEET